MRKIFLDRIESNEIVIDGEEHQHLAYSLRARVGDEIILCANRIDYIAEIKEITSKKTVLKVISSKENDTEPITQMTLFFGALKGDKNEYIVQKCTELGVNSLVPFISEFSSVRAENIKIDRLYKIAKEASKQCGRGIVPIVEQPQNIINIYEKLKEYDLVVFPYEKEKTTTIKQFIKDRTNSQKIAIIIGSEGGFSETEATEISQISGGSITLGKRILRADTACVAVLSVLMNEFGEWVQ